MKKALTEFSINHPWIVIGIVAVITAFFAIQIPNIKIDTDPENMLEEDEPVRVFDRQVKEEFGISDFIAVGVVSEEGAFNKRILSNVYKIIEEIEDIDGVIADDIMAPSTVDDIQQTPDGVLKVETLLEDEPETDSAAQYVLGRIKGNPILRGKLGSDNGKAIAMFIPIEAKDMSYRISNEIKAIIDKYSTGEEYYIAGLPIAQDSFGSEMFKQMALSAPMAGAIIFLLMLMFFRQVKIVIPPMIVAIVSVIWAMGLLIATGHTVHIMSSMIPIFLIPIAVLNSIHIISEFHDRYQKYKHKKTTIRNTISELFIPMLFTSLTTVVGFLSLATTPIPPVRVFGIFVAFGIFSAWILSLTLNPAFAIMISDKTLRNFGKKQDEKTGPLSKALHFFRDITAKYYKLILAGAVVVIIFAVIGLNMIVVNDNPVKWFKKDHPIRIADRTMNKHLAGTYMNYLVIDGGEPDAIKNPDLLKYMVRLQEYLDANRIVGATASITDIVKKVRFELFNQDSAKYAIPDNQNEVAQNIFLYEISGGDPDDLFKMINTDYSKANIWVQMTEGDNRSVSSVIDDAKEFMDANPPPVKIEANWAGLPYVNIVWQQKMVGGMRSALLGSFAVVFIMMIILFRSFILGIISMLPLTITIMAIYGAIGYIGKPYDMPIAVLSSLTLGLSIDFAIHFIKRSKYIHARTGNFQQTFPEMFEGLGRAISRNVLVISIGFVPMFFSNLVPYVTVGSFFFAIMMVSGAVTILLLPSIFKMWHKKIMPKADTESIKDEEKVAQS
ncbi:MAG: MMPL family transporter [candidate division Zixibacteria bacterium]|nr:MMPL family transporter [candidate division Zixibacteria bacterium]